MNLDDPSAVRKAVPASRAKRMVSAKLYASPVPGEGTPLSARFAVFLGGSKCSFAVHKFSYRPLKAVLSFVQSAKDRRLKLAKAEEPEPSFRELGSTELF